MSLTVQLEAVSSVWNEIMVLANIHWEGTRSFQRHFPFNPSYERYRQCNELGFFQLFTARDETRKLAGYFGCYLAPSMHSQHLMLTEDTFFLLPEYRRGRNALQFVKAVEAQAVLWGVQEIMFSCEYENEVSHKILKHLDYRPVIVQYSKRLVPPPTSADSAQPTPTEDSHVRSISSSST